MVVHILTRFSPHFADSLTKLTALNPTAALPRHHWIKRYRFMIQLLLIRYTHIKCRFGIKLPDEEYRMWTIHFDNMPCDRGSVILQCPVMSAACWLWQRWNGSKAGSSHGAFLSRELSNNRCNFIKSLCVWDSGS